MTYKIKICFSINSTTYFAHLYCTDTAQFGRTIAMGGYRSHVIEFSVCPYSNPIDVSTSKLRTHI